MLPVNEPENHLTSTKNRKNTSTGDRLCVNDVINGKTKRTVEPSLSELTTSKECKSIETIENEKKCARVVKNLNEFLNFTSLNRSKVGPSDERELRRVSSESGVIRVVREEANSPDDPTDFFPMTTSMTRELRLEVESLDRQVFGPSSSSEENFGSITTTKRDPDGLECETEVETEMARCSPAADVFVWENPLHKLQQKNSSFVTTPDEQTEIEYDGEIMEDENGVKSVTPIRLLKRTPR